MKGRFIPALLAICLIAVGLAAAADEDFDSLMSRAKSMLRNNHPEEAIKAYKKAIKLEPSKAETYWRLAQAYSQVRAYKDAAETCQKGLLVADRDELKAILHAVSGQAYEELGANEKKKLAVAEHEYREALSLRPSPALVQFQLGRVLMKMGRDEEGKAVLTQFVDAHRDAPEKAPITRWVQVAQKLIENPRRAREPYVPDFSLTTADGSYISSDDLVGKIVVLDFWGTWCPPCRDSVGDLRSMAKHFANDPVVVIGISSDTDEARWRKFVVDNKMDWPQYIDTDRHLIKLFGINSYPTYLMVDADGVMRKVEHGSGTLGWIEDEVKKSLKTMAKSKPPASSGATQ